MLDELTKDIPSLRNGIRRFPARMHELFQSPLVIPYRERLGAVDNTRTRASSPAVPLLLTCSAAGPHWLD